MSITELGALGEFVGAFAVVATLIYLSVQVRRSKEAMEENSRLIHAAVLETTFTHFSQFRRHIIDNSDVARIWREGCADHELLNDDDSVRFEQLGEELVYGFNSVFSQATAAGNEELSRGLPVTLATMMSSDPGIRTIWKRVRVRLTATGRSRFAEAVDKEIELLMAQPPEMQQ